MERRVARERRDGKNMNKGRNNTMTKKKERWGWKEQDKMNEEHNDEKKMWDNGK